MFPSKLQPNSAAFIYLVTEIIKGSKTEQGTCGGKACSAGCMMDSLDTSSKPLAPGGDNGLISPCAMGMDGVQP
jgi:hypothetical protein